MTACSFPTSALIRRGHRCEATLRFGAHAPLGILARTLAGALRTTPRGPLRRRALLSDAGAMQARPGVAHAEHDYAAILVARGEAADGSRLASWAHRSALQTYRSLGMTDWAARGRSGSASLAPLSAASTPTCHHSPPMPQPRKRRSSSASSRVDATRQAVATGQPGCRRARGGAGPSTGTRAALRAPRRRRTATLSRASSASARSCRCSSSTS